MQTAWAQLLATLFILNPDTRPFLGLHVTSQRGSGPTARGVRVLDVTPCGPAETAGIKVDDVLVVKVDEQIVSTDGEFDIWMSELKIGDSTQIIVWSNKFDSRGRRKWMMDRVNITPISEQDSRQESLRRKYVKIGGAWFDVPAVSCRESKPLNRFAVGAWGSVERACRVMQVVGPGDISYRSTMTLTSGFTGSRRMTLLTGNRFHYGPES